MYLKKDEWLFISTMKCGTNTLYAALQNVGAKWAGGGSFHAIPRMATHPIPNAHEEMVRLAPVHWTVCRNPYARAVSIWSSTCIRKENRTRYPAWKMVKDAGGDPRKFDDFVYVMLDDPPNVKNPFLWRNQSDWHDLFIHDKVARLEHLEDDVEEIIGERLKLGYENKSEHAPWESYYSSPVTESIVATWGAEDFKRFGYER